MELEKDRPMRWLHLCAFIAFCGVGAAFLLPNDRPVPLPESRSMLSPDRLTAIFSIAAALVQESREAYYATGRPCACPQDRMEGGKRCGFVSAWARPGGAEPLCHPTSVPFSSIQERLAERAPGGR
jgi:hypothetical protein